MRFTQADDQLGQADAELTLGLAQRGNEQFDEALSHFNQALTLYQRQPQPLGEADTRYERAGIFLARGELQQAEGELRRAIALVERVMKTLKTPEQWRLFLQQYTELYAQHAITLARLGREGEAQGSLQGFAHIAGPAELKSYLHTFEASIPADGEQLTEEQLAENQALHRLLHHLRKGL